MSNLKVAVIGGGAMGSLFSSLLCASAGPQSVLRVTRGRNPSTIKREGVNIKCATAATASLWNDVATKFASSHGIQRLSNSLFHAPVSSSSMLHDKAAVLDFGADVALVLVKSFDTEGAAAAAAVAVERKRGVVVTLQNGMGNVEKLRSRVGVGNQVFGGSTSMGCLLDKDSEGTTVIHTGLGPVSIASDHPTVVELVSVLRSSQVDASVVSERDLKSLLWTKLAVNASINPLTSILDVPNGYLVHDPYCQGLVTRVCSEVGEVCRKEGLDLSADFLVKSSNDVATRTAANTSSMRADVLNKRNTEVDSILGYIISRGRDHNVPVDTCKVLYDLVKIIEKKGRQV